MHTTDAIVLSCQDVVHQVHIAVSGHDNFLSFGFWCIVWENFLDISIHSSSPVILVSGNKQYLPHLRGACYVLCTIVSSGACHREAKELRKEAAELGSSSRPVSLWVNLSIPQQAVCCTVSLQETGVQGNWGLVCYLRKTINGINETVRRH